MELVVLVAVFNCRAYIIDSLPIRSFYFLNKSIPSTSSVVKTLVLLVVILIVRWIGKFIARHLVASKD